MENEVVVTNEQVEEPKKRTRKPKEEPDYKKRCKELEKEVEELKNVIKNTEAFLKDIQEMRKNDQQALQAMKERYVNVTGYIIDALDVCMKAVSMAVGGRK